MYRSMISAPATAACGRHHYLFGIGSASSKRQDLFDIGMYRGCTQHHFAVALGRTHCVQRSLHHLASAERNAREVGSLIALRSQYHLKLCPSHSVLSRRVTLHCPLPGITACKSWVLERPRIRVKALYHLLIPTATLTHQVRRHSRPLSQTHSSSSVFDSHLCQRPS